MKTDPDTILSVAYELIDSLKSVHSTGRTYNDIKPENVMITGSNVTLVDYGLALKFIDNKGKHFLPDEEVSKF